jgi:hypothetical protein
VLIWSLCNELLCDVSTEAPIDSALRTKAVVKREDPISQRVVSANQNSIASLFIPPPSSSSSFSSSYTYSPTTM